MPSSNGKVSSGSQEFLPPSPHTTHRAVPQWAVPQVGSLDDVLRLMTM
ncbi:hypothetical protein [Candidatus Symbiobacter mobilis]|nr:hypothetical protein [Candidatus Symbiobacter mobilis]